MIIKSIAAYHKSTQGEILDIIGPDLFFKAKKERPGGIFKSYVLAHEGVSTVTDIDSNSIVNIIWEKKALVAAYPKIDVSGKIKFFDKHDFIALELNDNSSRQPVGSLVGKATKIIDGVESIIIVGHFPKEFKEIAEKSDSVSMESNWILDDRNGKTYAKGIDNIEAVALASSEDGEASGFPNAKEISKIAAYTETENNMADTIQQNMANKEDVIRTWFDPEIFINRIRDHNVRITQAHEPRDIIGKRLVDKSGNVKYDGRPKVQDSVLVDFVEKEIVNPFVTEGIKYRKTIEEQSDKIKELEHTIAFERSEPELKKYAEKNKFPGYVLKMALKLKEKMIIGDDLNKSIEEHFKTTQETIEELKDAGAVFTDDPKKKEENKDLRTDPPLPNSDNKDEEWGDEDE